VFVAEGTNYGEAPMTNEEQVTHTKSIEQSSAPGSDAENPALVLLHGTAGFSENWSGVIDHLENRIVIRPDYLNMKGRNRTTDPTTVAEAAVCVLEAINARVDGPFDLVGYSLGASVATFIAAEYPEKVRSLVLISGFAHGDDAWLKLQFNLWLDLARSDRRALTRLLLLTGFSRDFVARFDQNTMAAVVDQFAASTDWEAVQQSIRLDLDFDVREQAPGVSAPILAITAKHDQIVPALYSQQLADLIPGAQQAEIDSGHLSFLEQPARLARVVSMFLDSRA
jgi:3-oxoadipate enol-lactonase